ncbi:MAG: FprA family A-type flavoprotein [Candidatus Altiarchaeota archaeon]
MNAEIRKGIHSIGSLDWDRRLFDELIPLPDGTSYNCYLVRGSQKTVLIDTVDPAKEGELVANLEIHGLRAIDYVVAHHAEQDHSGSIPKVLEMYPGAKVLCTEKCKELLKDHLKVAEDRFMTVKDGQEVPLGGRTLTFIHTPWVHWPETMVTYLKEDEILFSCDFFGSHLATSSLYAADNPKVLQSAKRYYAEIMMPFRGIIRSNLEKLRPHKIGLIAPSHGPIHEKPQVIIDSYREWTSDAVKNEAVIAYVSMHGSTRQMVDHLVEALMERGVTVKPYNLPKTDIGELAMDLVDAATLVVATPTVLVGPHPAAVYAAFLTNALRPKLRHVAVIGSYGWGGKAVETLASMIGNLKAEVLEPVLAKGQPKEKDFKALDRLADSIAERHKKL